MLFPAGKMWEKGQVSALLVVKIRGIGGTITSVYLDLIVCGMDESRRWMTCSGDMLEQSKSSNTKCVVARCPEGTMLRRSSKVLTSTGLANSANARCVFPHPEAPAIH
jgi:hypothetical protein